MFLDNYHKIRKQSIACYTDSGFIVDLGYKVVLSDGSAVPLTQAECNGPDRLIRATSLSNTYTSIPAASAIHIYHQKFVVFGDGDTPVSTSDYSISGNRISTISIVSITATYNDNGVKIIYNCTNKSQSPITIKEVCIFDNFGNIGGNTRKVALWREVFDTPLTVPAGSAFTYNFEVDLTTGG